MLLQMAGFSSFSWLNNIILQVYTNNSMCIYMYTLYIYMLSSSVMSDSLQLYDLGMPVSSVPDVLQVRILEWVAMTSSRGSSQPRGQTHVCQSPALVGMQQHHVGSLRMYQYVYSIYVQVQSLSCILLFATRWTVARPLFMGFPRQEYWNGLPFSPPGDLLNPGLEHTSPASPALQVDFLPLRHRGGPCHTPPIVYY